MSLSDKLSNDLKESMKSGDKIKVSVLRMIRSEIKNREIEKGSSLDDDTVMSVLGSFSKKARDSIEQFSKAGRTDLADKEKGELDIILGYLPAQMSEGDLRKLVKKAIEETGASGPKGMGMVMKAVMAEAKGQADGKAVNKLVKEMLEA